MNPLRRIAPAVLLLAATLPSPAAEKEDEPKIYSCTDATGAALFQDEPCEVTKSAPAPKPAPVPKAAPALKPRSASRTVPAAPPARSSSTYRFKPTIPAPLLKNVPWEPTWRAFVDAMAQGDRAAAVRCLTSRALTDLGPRIQAADPEALKGMVGAYDRVIVEGDVGPYWSIRVLRPGQRPKWVFFERTPRGEWKIAAI